MVRWCFSTHFGPMNRSFHVSQRKPNEPTSLAMRTSIYPLYLMDSFRNLTTPWIGVLPTRCDVNKTKLSIFLDDVVPLRWFLQPCMAGCCQTHDQTCTDQPNPSPCPYDNPKPAVFSSRTLPSVRALTSASFRGPCKNLCTSHEARHGRKSWLAGESLVPQFYDENLADRFIVQIVPLPYARESPLLPRKIISPALKLRGSSTIWTGSCGNSL